MSASKNKRGKSTRPDVPPPLDAEFSDIIEKLQRAESSARISVKVLAEHVADIDLDFAASVRHQARRLQALLKRIPVVDLMADEMKKRVDS